MIKQVFDNLKSRNLTGFIPYIVGGYPDNKVFAESLEQLDILGADMIEIGVPFSDPIAEGKVIEKAHHESIKQNFKISELLSLITKFKKKSNTPIILMGYTNSFIQPSIGEFCKNAKSSGVDGFLIVDLPNTESSIFSTIHQHNLETIQLIAPTSSEENIMYGLKNNPSIIYYITQRGVTGLSNIDMNEVSEKINFLRSITDIPVITGFGIKSETQVNQFKNLTDGIVIGSGIVEKLSVTNPNKKLQVYLKPIIEAIKNE
ncbi:MAG: tryptophan synthase subunit alpha [Gammaproteobacteria bacterium]|nr:tryptophan synthase subunit alpha [Gammaproteobacteria bacterium]MBA4729602.1 tryptophan synthase subunit alpha [SAR86 cluster bacterium]|tara:strand:+ start:1128 stop:1907 length:780 start_codon:yes stop_codon:yes gene_type:complete